MARRWPLALGLVAGLAALLIGLQTGTDAADQWGRAARWTARVGLPIFLTTYLAYSLARLWPAPLTRALWRDRRWWGLGFAACHAVHFVALVKAIEASGEQRTFASLIPGGSAYLVLVLMTLTSSDVAMRGLGRNWKRLHTFGIHYVWLIFALAYSLRLLEPDTRPEAVYGTALCFSALIVRVAARRKTRAPA